MIDVSTLSADERSTAKVYIEGSAATPETAAGFEVLGVNSAEYLGLEAKLVALRLRGAKENADLANNDEKSAKAGIARANEDATLITLACTVGWFGFTSKGEPLPFSKEALATLLKTRPRWAYVIKAGVENEANFSRG